MTDEVVEVRSALSDDRRAPLRVSGVPIWHVSEDEVAEIVERLAFCARQSGLKGHALDVALANSLAAIVHQLESERAMNEQGREKVRHHRLERESCRRGHSLG